MGHMSQLKEEYRALMDLVSPKTGEAKYLLAPPVVGFFEFSMMRTHDMFDKLSVAKAMDAYMHGDDTFAREVFGNDTVIGRAMVHEDVLARSIPEVLDWERTTRLIEESDQIAVSHCYCRHKAEHLGKACDVPQVNGYQDSPEEYIYNRLLALYCQLHYTGFGRVDLARQGRDAIDWHDEALTKLWSSVNRESAEKYSEAVEQLERAELRRSTFPD